MKVKFILRFIAVALLLGAIGLGAYTAFRSSDKVDDTQVFASNTMLSGLWNNYKQNYWEKDTGRTLDKQQNSITTSEGQSYTMLRAVWQSDKPTFDASWKWTKEQLQRKDSLFSWRWGKKTDGSYGILTSEGGQNTASDADSDIALALVMAASRWQQQPYLDAAKEIVSGMWDQEVVTIKNIPYLASNNLEKQSSSGNIIINPSYLAPYAYRVFSKIDPRHDWSGLVGSSYDVINRAMDSTLDTKSSSELVPDWVMIDRRTANIHAPTNASNLTTRYGYDAMRTPWRLALDYQWNKEPRALATLKRMEFLNKQWGENGKLAAIYSHDGTVYSGDEPPETYGTAIGFFKFVHPDVAKKIYDKKLKSLYDPNSNGWAQPMNYYSDNWTWFGIALQDNQLEDLAGKL